MKNDLAQKYGRLVVNFVNAGGTDDAVLSFLRNLQGCFSFSHDFYNSIKNRFPSAGSIAGGLSDDEKKLLDVILDKNEIVGELNDKLKLINYGIEHYDPRTRTISLTSLERSRDPGDGTTQEMEFGPGPALGGGFLQTLKLLGLSIADGPVAIKIDAIRAEIEEFLGPVAAGQLSSLIRSAHEIEEFLLTFGGQSYEKIELLAKEQREIFDFHKKIAAIQTDCSDTLRMITQGRPFHDIPALAKFLAIYNQAGPHRLVIGSGNRLLTVFPIDEHADFATQGIQAWQVALQRIVAYCLIEFLKPEKNIAHLKKCLTCSRFFLASRPKIQKYCNKQCRLKRNNSV
ncbi:hypothetical protein D1AOALGA4SA_13140 [Olavius algarvensis Delta 1 endosymbiont]|nr:hypothetical protein D1AOALGA4SA_13140 [Olavius algarvensis Delta 1 endosymbiont]